MDALVRRLADLSAAQIDLVGGKAANLGELVRADFPVPDGFVLTTEAYALAARAAGVDPNDPQAAAAQLRTSPVPEAVAAAAREAYAALGRGSVAVRSSATAEDLPGASFAGQQDTFLNVEGDDALLLAIARCWASLWNERAVAYRRANTIDDRGVQLAVVIQRMVDAAAAGVLFTADPLTGRRRRAAIDAIAALGEQLVSGAVDPDHYVVDTATREVLERRAIAAQPVLSEPELLDLAALGDRVEAHFGAPQDIEFALDQSRKLWLVQSRAITTLYPLPETAPAQSDLRVYFSANVFQGYFEPLTPMGIQFFRLLGTSVWHMFGARIDAPRAGPSALVEAGMRLFVDLTPVIRDAFGRMVLVSIMGVGEARSSVVLARLATDARLSLGERSRGRTVRRIISAVARAGILRNALRVLRSPHATRARFKREMDCAAAIRLPPHADATARLDAFERLLLVAPLQVLPRLLGIMAPAMLTLGLATRLLRGIARPDELQTLTRSAPDNPTTEMDLALWSLSARVRGDARSCAALLESSPADLAEQYRAGSLPPPLQSGVAEFLRVYGFRSIGEIDIGVPRWSEDPTHILGALANYVRLGDNVLAPDAQFAKGERDAEAMLRSLLSRVHGPRRLLLALVLRRMRIMIGSREAPKFHIIRLLATPARELIKPVGAELAARGSLADPDDIFFLTLPEARRAVSGDDVRELVSERRRIFAREHARRRIPRVMLSDGTDAEAALVSTEGGGLRGSPASPGVSTGIARVILSPQGARLEPGEILVAPSTDPGWTPLFLTAGGLVMEMGGMMSHGAVVAREYGIPAVVGVTGATEQIRTGQGVTVDGSAGTVVLN